MNLNDLPDDCLLTIFDNFDLIEDFLSLSKVCSKWAELSSQRLSKIKWLLFEERKSNYPGKVIYMKDPKILKTLNLKELLPNLEILDIAYGKSKVTYKKFEKIINDNPKIKGIIEGPYCRKENEPRCLRNIQMIAAHRFDWKLAEIYCHNKLTQLVGYEGLFLSSLKYFTEYFQNLQRLHMYNNDYTYDFYGIPFLNNLKILEISSKDSLVQDFIHTEYFLMDFCPSLESAFFYNNGHDFEIDESIKNYNLRDLVIEHLNYCKNHKRFNKSQDWPSLRSLLSKYPKLKHLAIRGNNKINDDNIKELKDLLPEIELMDFRDSPHVTQESANYFARYFERSGRSIKIYFNCSIVERQDCPQSGDPNAEICLGFDFMKHCFFRTWMKLPCFMVPE